jgi:hypothetical protein
LNQCVASAVAFALFLRLDDDDHQNSGRLFTPTRLVAPSMFTDGTYVDVEPEGRTGRRDSDGGKASEEVEWSDDDERVAARSEGHVQARVQTQRRFPLSEDRSESPSEERRALIQVDGGHWK